MHKIGESLIYEGLWYNKDGGNAGIWSYSEEEDQFDGKWQSWDGFVRGNWNYTEDSQTSGTWSYEDGSEQGTWTEDSDEPSIKHDTTSEEENSNEPTLGKSEGELCEGHDLDDPTRN